MVVESFQGNMWSFVTNDNKAVIRWRWGGGWRGARRSSCSPDKRETDERPTDSAAIWEAGKLIFTHGFKLLLTNHFASNSLRPTWFNFQPYFPVTYTLNWLLCCNGLRHFRGYCWSISTVFQGLSSTWKGSVQCSLSIISCLVVRKPQLLAKNSPALNRHNCKNNGL